ncbi:alpha-amylase family glycosyl hydrolase [Jiulongibacter sp. NS-SX5]|uniref:alpha-amylase family glycosyl hydrolase n=1 Tax=Jiulongibacter sp. NS-SX5 TaxID=3463854 RepID=UPI00405A3542
MKPESTASISNGVMLNAYPDSIGEKLGDLVAMLQMPELKDTFSLFYVLPTFFNSDLDRGFSIIDYNHNTDLVAEEDIEALKALQIRLKFDIVLNHLSVASPQFKDLLKNGDNSEYKDFFINWNDFWEGHGEMNEEGIIIPEKEYLDKLFMRKSGLPILNVPFPDGTERPYWNTFYQKVSYPLFTASDLSELKLKEPETVSNLINSALEGSSDLKSLDFGKDEDSKRDILKVVNSRKSFLGQMDVNGKSPLVWDFYEEVLAKVGSYGCQILRLDAFAYLHKEVGESNFYNKPGTWDYLAKINEIATKNQLQLLPEIHAEYGLHLHDEVAAEGYVIYDFFLPGLLIHTLEKGNNTALLKWGNDILREGFKTVNMLGCHDGIPVLDLKGKEVNGTYQEGLLSDEEIEDIMELVLARGGRVKNLYGADGKKISYYQVNATYYSALGESDQKMLLARAIQLFMPGIPQVWYLDVFVGKNDYEAADKAGEGGHKEINRTNLSLEQIKEGLKKQVVIQQLELIRLRNTHPAFEGNTEFLNSSDSEIIIEWKHEDSRAKLTANLKTHQFIIDLTENGQERRMSY